MTAPVSSRTWPRSDALCAHAGSAETKHTAITKLLNLINLDRCILIAFTWDRDQELCNTQKLPVSKRVWFPFAGIANHLLFRCWREAKCQRFRENSTALVVMARYLTIGLFHH